MHFDPFCEILVLIYVYSGRWFLLIIANPLCMVSEAVRSLSHGRSIYKYSMADDAREREEVSGDEDDEKEADEEYGDPDFVRLQKAYANPQYLLSVDDLVGDIRGSDSAFGSDDDEDEDNGEAHSGLIVEANQELASFARGKVAELRKVWREQGKNPRQGVDANMKLLWNGVRGHIAKFRDQRYEQLEMSRLKVLEQLEKFRTAESRSTYAESSDTWAEKKSQADERP